MKFTLFLLVVAITVSFSTALNYTFGRIDHRFDRLVYSKDVYQKSKFMGSAEAYVDYPAPGHIGYNLTAINVINKIEKGAKPKIKAGGIYHKYATLKLTSPFRAPINATVEMYARLR